MVTPRFKLIYKPIITHLCMDISTRIYHQSTWYAVSPVSPCHTLSHHGITSPAGGFHKDSSMANLLQSRASRVHSDDQFLLLMVGGFVPRKWNFSRLAKSENLYRCSIWKRYLNHLESEWMIQAHPKNFFETKNSEAKIKKRTGVEAPQVATKSWVYP